MQGGNEKNGTKMKSIESPKVKYVNVLSFVFIPQYIKGTFSQEKCVK
jgi:hypothetical protein